MAYTDIAPYVNLDPFLNLRDAPKFQFTRARLPTFVFKEIVQDMQLVMKQYGPPIEHNNVEARSRFLAPVGIFYMSTPGYLVAFIAKLDKNMSSRSSTGRPAYLIC